MVVVHADKMPRYHTSPLLPDGVEKPAGGARLRKIRCCEKPVRVIRHDGRQTGDQSQLFYLFNLEGRIPAPSVAPDQPFVTSLLMDLRGKLESFYSEFGRPSIDPELMIRMLIVSYCYGIRSERKLCEEVELHLAYRWFCRLGLEDKVPNHSTFSVQSPWSFP
jgi:hypothetical protein